STGLKPSGCSQSVLGCRACGRSLGGRKLIIRSGSGWISTTSNIGDSAGMLRSHFARRESCCGGAAGIESSDTLRRTMTRALVTGGAGFIGSHIADRLLAEGYEVGTLDDLSTGLRMNVADGVEFWETDLCDVAAVRRILSDFRPEVIFHLAAQMDVRRSTREPEFDARVNVLGGLSLLREAIGAGVRRVVYASTGGAVDRDVPP